MLVDHAACEHGYKAGDQDTQQYCRLCMVDLKAETEARPKHPLNGLRDYLALEPNILVLLVGLFVIGMGEELWVRFMPKYLEGLGATIVIIGTFASFMKVVDALYQYPGGWLSDRLGRKRALVMFTIIAILGYLIYLLSASWELVFVGTLFVLAWSSMSQPAIFALIGDTLGKSKRAMGFSVQSIWKRVPIVIAPVIGGILMTRWGLINGMRIGFVVSIVLALAAVYIQSHYYHTPQKSKNDGGISLISVWRLMPGALRSLLLADCMTRFGANLAAVYVILLVINLRGKTSVDFGLYIGLQMMVAIALYIPAAWIADRIGRRPLILVTFTLFVLFPLALIALPPELLVVAFILAGLREFGEPARKALIVDLAADTHRGRVVGFYYLVRGLAVIPAPIIGAVLWQRGYQWPFICAGLISLIGLGLFAYFSRGKGFSAHTRPQAS
jgi:MFS family permease